MGRFCRRKNPAAVTGRARIGDRTACDRSAVSFKILGVDYYGQADGKTLADSLGQDYRRILVDFGEMTETAMTECARCDRKLIIGSFAEWKAEAFLELGGQSREWNDSWRLAAVFGSRETEEAWEKAFGKRCLRIPFSEDAYLVCWEDMRFFYQLFD